MVNWEQFLETQDVTIRLPSLPLALALLVPAGGYALRKLATLPKVERRQKFLPGLKDIPDGPVKTRIQEIYPDDLLGPAQYADFPFGKTKYTIAGPADGRKVVLIHGFSIPSMLWQDVASRLVDAGFQVLTYDLYGRGYSETPEELGPLYYYTTQLALLLQHVKWDKARIVGLSMGGGIAAAFSTQFPDLVERDVALLASAGAFPDNWLGATAFFTLPLFPWIGASTILQWLKPAPPPATSKLGTIGELVALQTRALPRFGQTLAQTARYGPLRGLGLTFKKLGESNLRALIVHGTADVIVPYKPYLGILAGYLPKAKVVSLENVGHELVISHPDEVSAALIEHFNSA